MDRLSLAVIFGGRSSEYDISLQSAGAIIKSLDAGKYDTVLLGIDRQGEWLRYYGGADDIISDRWRTGGRCKRAVISPSSETRGVIEFDAGAYKATRLDAAFPVLHGKNGEDGTVQGVLELAGIPIVGCGCLSSALCMDKELAHIAARDAGIECPRGFSIRSLAELDRPEMAARQLNYPLFVKPARSGSSFGITCVKQQSQLIGAAEAAFEHDAKVVIEEAVDGIEVGCAVIGNGDDLILGRADEIELHGDMFDFVEKYTLKSSKIHMPARISGDAERRVADIAARVYRALGCQVFARVDMFLTHSGRILFNEVNTIPGFTEHSRFPNMMRGAGYTFERTVDKLIEVAVSNSAALR
ncbi:MAG: D-alanine--D-serine ligase VanG [Oscillospiraceae bacterium]|nr:D-alanine--D-serine ligase VanG [Oscillospiraceae bacterium]